MPDTHRISPLPLSLAPRGLSRVQAAAYVGVSPTKFDEMVHDGRMPQPKRVDGRVIWDKVRLDEAFEGLPDIANKNPWDVAMGGRDASAAAKRDGSGDA